MGVALFQMPRILNLFRRKFKKIVICMRILWMPIEKYAGVNFMTVRVSVSPRLYFLCVRFGGTRAKFTAPSLGSSETGQERRGSIALELDEYR